MHPRVKPSPLPSCCLFSSSLPLRVLDLELAHRTLLPFREGPIPLDPGILVLPFVAPVVHLFPLELGRPSPKSSTEHSDLPTDYLTWNGLVFLCAMAMKNEQLGEHRAHTDIRYSTEYSHCLANWLSHSLSLASSRVQMLQSWKVQ